MTITEQLATALRVLAFMARTSGGTAGRDDGLCAACDKAEDVITAYEASKASPDQDMDNGLRQVREVLREFIKDLARAGFPSTVRIGTNLQSLSNGMQLHHIETLLHHLDDAYGAAYEASEKSRPRTGGVEMTITEQLAAALGKIKLCASPMDRTFDKMIQDMDWILAEARYALAAYEASRATPTLPLLWCCHVRGPDDVHPAPDYQTALKWSDMINDWSDEANARFKDGEKVMSKAAPALWPWSPESHAQNLAKAIADFSPRLPKERAENEHESAG